MKRINNALLILLSIAVVFNLYLVFQIYKLNNTIKEISANYTELLEEEIQEAQSGQYGPQENINDIIPIDHLYCFHCGYELHYAEDFIECPVCLTELNYVSHVDDNEVLLHYFPHREN